MSLDISLMIPPVDAVEVGSFNITHNLTEMAGACELYSALWHPETVNIRRAWQLIGPLEKGLQLLEADPERFEQFNPANGWGDYHGFVRFVKELLEKCEEFPHAEVRVRG